MRCSARTFRPGRKMRWTTTPSTALARVSGPKSSSSRLRTRTRSFTISGASRRRIAGIVGMMTRTKMTAAATTTATATTTTTTWTSTHTTSTHTTSTVSTTTTKLSSIFCYMVVRVKSFEIPLAEVLYEKRASIFSCDAWRVLSNGGPANIRDYKAVVIKQPQVELGNLSKSGTTTSSWLNTMIFMEAWELIFDDGEWWNHDWTVKVDPDAVFFPDRLAKMLVPYAKTGGYINNCKYGMHGPIEVFSTDAIDILAADYRRSWDGKAPKSCSTELHFGLWGEDMFIDQCLSKVLEVGPRPTEPKLMCESHCDCPAWYWCGEGPDVVSYHPFKSVDSWKNCMANALAQDGGDSAIEA
mmetsp:Transcript_75918/g.212838  ORF Transcript_75918/g.212838 Transcript_75918/m.212838 type:complete len:355 (-) Transcript_75918:73-1137(-)